MRIFFHTDPTGQPTADAIERYFPFQPQQLAGYFQGLFWRGFRSGDGLYDGHTCMILGGIPFVTLKSTLLNPEAPLVSPYEWSLSTYGALRITMTKKAGLEYPDSWKGEAVALEADPEDEA